MASHWALAHHVGQHYEDRHWFGDEPDLIVVTPPVVVETTALLPLMGVGS